MLKKGLIIIFSFYLCCNLFVSNMCYASETAEENDGRNRLSINSTGSEDMLVIPIHPEDLKEIETTLTAVMSTAEWPKSISAVLMDVPGQEPAIILNGNSKNIRAAEAVLQPYLNLFAERKMIAIIVDVREVIVSDDEAVGLMLLADGKATASLSRGTTWQEVEQHSKNNQRITTKMTRNITDKYSEKVASPTNALSFLDSLGEGRHFISGEIYTNNGEMARITDSTSHPMITNTKGGITIQTKYLTTSIEVLPVIVDYNQEDVGKSQVKLDIKAKTTYITGIKTVSNIEVPETATKELNTVRLLQANNELNIAGVLTTDVQTNSNQGIPWLRNIPIIRWFVSTDKSSTKRVVTIISVSARIIPKERVERNDEEIEEKNISEVKENAK